MRERFDHPTVPWYPKIESRPPLSPRIIRPGDPPSKGNKPPPSVKELPA